MPSKSFENADKLDRLQVSNNIATFVVPVSTTSLLANSSVGVGIATPTSNLHVVGSSRLQGNVTITGDLSCAGTQTFANTVFVTTSALSVVNVGSGAALYVGNSGVGDIASFYDIDQGVEVLHIGGNNGTFPNVGVKTSSPNKTLTVNGEISASSDIWTGGKFRGDGSLLTGIASGTTNALPLSGGTLGGSLSGTTATFSTSVSAPALSGVHFGDGSKLTGVIASGGTATDNTKLPLTGGTLNGALIGTIATFSTSVSAPALSGTFFGDGSNLTNLDASDIASGTLNTARLPAVATFSASVSAPALSGVFFGDGSKLTGVIASGGTATDNTKLPLTGGTLNGSLVGTVATFSASVSAPALSGVFFGDGSNLTNLDASDIASGTLNTARLPAVATFSASVSAPALSGTFFGDGSNLTNLDASDIALGTLNTARLPAVATFSASVSAPALSGVFFGDGSKLTNTSDPNRLPLSGGNINGSLNVSDNFGLGTTTPSTKMHVIGNSRLQGNVTITGDLSCTGTQTFANTIFTTTSALSIVNVGSGAALYVGNNGIGDIASFYDIDANVEVLHVGGNNGTFPNVGVKTSSPNKTLTVNGEISAAQDITTSGNLIGTRATFSTSVSAPSLSGTFFGDGSRLTGAGTPSVYGGKSGTYVITSSDTNSIISFNSSSICYLQIPSDATNIPIGSQFTIIQEGLGNVVIQIVPSSGVSLQSYGSMYTTTGQYAMATLIKTAASTWRLAGTLS